MDALRNRKLPAEVRDNYEQSTVDKSLDYGQDNRKLIISENFLKLSFSLAFVRLDAYKSLWDLSGTVLEWVYDNSANSSIKQALIYLCLQLALVYIAVTIPIHLYNTFVVEEKHGFNNSTLGHFWSQLLTLFAINSVIQCVFVGCLLKAIQIGGDSFVPYATAAVGLTFVIVLHLVPLTHSLFYKLTPLEDGELKSAVNKLAATHKFPSERIYVYDGSKGSSHSNAFFSGLPWSKKIVLFDTMVETSTPDEIVAVLAHEIGHWKKNDIFKLNTLTIATIASHLYVFSTVYKSSTFYEAFGFTDKFPVFIGYTIFQDLFKVIELANTLIRNSLSRALEYKADKFAASNGHKAGLTAGLTRLYTRGLSVTNIDWLYSIYSLAHPNFSERLSAIAATNVFDKEK